MNQLVIAFCVLMIMILLILLIVLIIKNFTGPYKKYVVFYPFRNRKTVNYATFDTV